MVIGMVYDCIPYMILPLFSIMAKMDVKLIEAARDLGCNGLGVLRRVIWPLSLPGVISGVTMVLIPSVSTFYISQKLGDGKIMLIGDVIEGQYVANNLHFAAAIAFVLMVLLLVCMAVMRKRGRTECRRRSVSHETHCKSLYSHHLRVSVCADRRSCWCSRLTAGTVSPSSPAFRLLVQGAVS